jgi:hypothetical protein
MAKSATKWLPLFRKYVKALRIISKHAESDPDGEGIELKLWTSQTRVLEQICDGLENGIHVFYVLKSRQLGVTTITLAITLFWLAYHANTIGIFVSENDQSSNKNRTTIRKYVASLAPFMGKSFSVVRDNRFGFEFSNGSRLDMRVAGKSKVNWGEGEGYIVGHLTEVQRFGKEEGLESFRHAMAPDNPRSLYIFEGTAAGPNHWKDMCEAAQADEFSSRFMFVGWWSHDRQKIRMSDPKFKKFGTYEPTPEENELISQVREQYNYEVTMEQLAWYRWQQTIPGSSEGSLDQNQPWTAEMAFVQSGVSFFQNRLLAQRRQFIIDANDELAKRQEAEGKEIDPSVENGGFGYKVYQFYLADEFHLCRVEEVDYAIPADQIKLRVWEKPHPEGIYVIGVDPAGGRSEDSNNHCVSVWRVFADKLVQVAEWADSIPETRHCAWVTAYMAGQYQNCRINIDLTGGIGAAVMQAFDDLRVRMRSEMYQDEIRKLAEKEMAENRSRREAEGKLPSIGHNQGPKWELDDFLPAANWHLYRRIDSPGPGFAYNTKLGVDLKFRMMNILRDSWVTNLIEVRSIPLLDEMANVVQTRGDIGASAPGRQRDDRTFGMALANWTWVENLRSGLISQGLTWDGARKKESGEISPLADQLNRRVFSILRAADEMADLPPPRTFFEQRGL